MVQNQLGSLIIIANLFLGTMLLHAQCNSWEAHPQGVQIAKEQHQVYRDLLRVNQFKEAFPVWQALFYYVQVPQEVPNRHFKDGIKLYKEQAKLLQDSIQKSNYLDTIVLLYNQLRDCVGENSLDRAWQGYDMYSLGNGIKDYEQAIICFERAIDLGKEKTTDIVLLPTAQLALYLFNQQQSKCTATYLTKLYYDLKNIADYQLKNLEKEAEIQKKWAMVHELFDSIKDSLTTIWGCAYYEEELKNKYGLDSNNLTQNQMILQVLLKHCGNASAFYQQVLKQQNYLSLNTYGGKPIDELPLLKQGVCREEQAKNFLKQGDTTLANQYQKMAWTLFEKAVEIVPDDSVITKQEQANLCYKLAYKSYQENNFEKARNYCRQASKWNPSWGEPYLLVGTMYASSSKYCEKDDDKSWSSKIVLWVAIDEWEKAKEVDVSAKEQANKNVKHYQQYLPTVEEAFKYGLLEGNSYKVNCWIQQTTTVKLSKE